MEILSDFVVELDQFETFVVSMKASLKDRLINPPISDFGLIKVTHIQ